MLRSMLAVAAGYISLTALDSFTHLIISIYFKTDLTLTGIAKLPSGFWVIVITVLQFAFGLFAGLLSTTLAKAKEHTVILGLILLIVAVSLMDFTILYDREPLWYIITAAGLRISGIVTGYYLQSNQ